MECVVVVDSKMMLAVLILMSVPSPRPYIPQNHDEEIFLPFRLTNPISQSWSKHHHERRDAFFASSAHVGLRATNIVHTIGCHDWPREKILPYTS